LAFAFARTPQPKQFWLVQGTGHEDLERFDLDACWRVVMPFLETNLRRRP